MKVLVGMSGGVDSSVTALLLKQRGNEVCGATLRLFTNQQVDAAPGAPCCGLDDVEDARRVAARIGIPHHVFDFSEPFDYQVIGRFIHAYGSGLTPNPCVDCNHRVKFPGLLQRAAELGYDHVATGHYARIGYDEQAARWTLSRAADPSKDQSYVLYTLTQEQLAHTSLPLGDLSKFDVRRIAHANGFGVADKPDSQDICFVRDGDYAGFLEDVGGFCEASGDIVDRSGIVLGHHRGLYRYTVGQRKGVEVTPISPQSRPYYVIGKDTVSNRLIVGHNDELGVRGCVVIRPNWVSIDRPSKSLHVQVKTRYRQTPVPAVIEAVTHRGEDERDIEVVNVTFEEPLDSVAPGQACVFYRGNLLLGGGTIV